MCINLQSTIFWKLTPFPTPSSWGWGLENMNFCAFLHFMQFLGMFCLKQGPHSIGVKVGNMSFLCRPGHFMEFLEKNIVFEINSYPYTPTPNGVEVGNIFFLCRSEHFIQFWAKGKLELYPLPMGWKVWTCLCRSGHFIQYLAKCFTWK